MKIEYTDWFFLAIIIAIAGLHIPLKAIHDELELGNDYTVVLIKELKDLNEKIPPTQQSLESPRIEQETETFKTHREI